MTLTLHVVLCIGDYNLGRMVWSVNPELTDRHMLSMLRRWFVEAQGAVDVSTTTPCVEACNWETGKTGSKASVQFQIAVNSAQSA